MSGRCQQGFALALVLGLALSGCANVGDEGEDADAELQVTYVGHTTPADLDGDNANVLAMATLQMVDDLDRLSRLLSHDTPEFAGASAQPLLSVTTDCAQGGSRTLTSNADVVRAEYLQCTSGDVTLDGWAVAAIRYPFAPDAAVETQIDTVRAAVRWVRRDLPTVGITPTDVVLAGGSAGADSTATGSPLTSGRTRMPMRTARLISSSAPTIHIHAGVLSRRPPLVGTPANSADPFCWRSVSDFFNASRMNDMC